MESSLIKKKIAILNKKMALAPIWCMQSEYLLHRPILKFNLKMSLWKQIFNCMHLLGVSAIFFKWSIFKNEREDSMDVVQYFSWTFLF